MRKGIFVGGVALVGAFGCGFGGDLSDIDWEGACEPATCTPEDATLLDAPAGPVAVGSTVQFSVVADCSCEQMLDSLAFTVDPPTAAEITAGPASGWGESEASVILRVLEPGPFTVSWSDGSQSAFWEGEALEVDEVSVVGVGDTDGVRHLIGSPALYTLQYRGQGQILVGEFEYAIGPEDWTYEALVPSADGASLLLTVPEEVAPEEPVPVVLVTDAFEAEITVIPTASESVDHLEAEIYAGDLGGLAAMRVHASTGGEPVVGVYPEWFVNNQSAGEGDLFVYSANPEAVPAAVEVTFGEATYGTSVALDEGAFAVRGYEMNRGCNSGAGAASAVLSLISGLLLFRRRK